MSGMRAISTTSTRAVIKFLSFFLMRGKAPKEIHVILRETLACFLPGRVKDLLSPLYKSVQFKSKLSHTGICSTAAWPPLRLCYRSPTFVSLRFFSLKDNFNTSLKKKCHFSVSFYIVKMHAWIAWFKTALSHGVTLRCVSTARWCNWFLWSKQSLASAWGSLTQTKIWRMRISRWAPTATNT